jgi:ribosomal-protein-alanine N-acetyltransferase
MVEIARFRLRHLRRILQIERAAFPESPYTRAVFRTLYSDCCDLFLIAKVSRRIAGYMASRLHPGWAEIVSVAVDPERRREGVGAALLTHTLEQVRQLGVRSVELMVRVDNEDAIRFYRRFGFRRAGVVPAYYETGQAGLHMRRTLRK